jgi:predicted Zn-dependent peptidase
MILKNYYLRLVASISLLALTLAPIISGQTPSLSRNLPEEEFLSNGLKLIYQKDTSSAITVLQILVLGGKGTEPEGKDGLAYLTARLALEIPDRGKIQAMMIQASRTSVMSYGDYSLINIRCLSEHLEETLKITTQIMLKPLFSGLRIDFIKKQMTYQRKRQEDDSINVGHNALLEKLFANTSLAGSVFGSEESLKAIKKKDK